MNKLFFALGLMLVSSTVVFAQAGLDPQNTLYLDLKDGRVVIKLRADLAPKHVERIKLLAREKFYDGIKFHRVIDGFMAQTGCPKGTGTGGSNYPNLPAEFNSEKFRALAQKMEKRRAKYRPKAYFSVFLVYPVFHRLHDEESELKDSNHTLVCSS